MPQPASSTERVQFGVFELDLQHAELRKNGIKVKLQEQPLKILQVLLEKPGEIVGRDELRQRAWPADTFVEFDQGLYSAMARLRDALGDSSDSPRFIETVARRGYRFIAPVTTHRTESITSVQSTTSPIISLSFRRLLLSLLAGLLGGALLLAAVLVFNVAGAREWLRNRTTPIRSLAVLPLENLSGDPEQDYFADGMTDELITTLARVGNVRVVSRTSIMRFKKTSKPLSEVGKDLNVDGIVEGTVERSGNRVRIRVQLIQASSDRHLWAQTYDRELRDTLLLQSEAARDIAAEIESMLDPAQKRRLASAHPVDPDAYEAYLKGLYFSNKRTVADFDHAGRYFEDAIARDPNYAPAYSGYAETLIGKAFAGKSFSDLRDKYIWAAGKSIELDPLSSEAHIAMASVHEFCDWDWKAADKEYRRAIELAPNSANAHQDYSVFLAFQARYEEAIAESQRAQELDPLSPFVRTTSCLVLHRARRYDQAIQECQEALELDPDFLHARGNLVRVYLAMGQYQRALQEFESEPAFRKGDSAATLALLRQAYNREGIKGWWRVRLQQRLAPGAEPPDGVDIATFYSLLKEPDIAFAWLEKGYQQRSPFMEALKSEPDFDNIRSDPRFHQWLVRLKFEP